jgi:hypothetical protein
MPRSLSLPRHAELLACTSRLVGSGPLNVAGPGYCPGVSLTSSLDDRGSSVSKFMVAELPGLRDWQAAYQARRPAEASALRPGTPEGVRPAWGTIGHAIDHRLRYAFADQDEPSLAVSTGMLLAAGGSDRAVTSAIGLSASGLRAALADLIRGERPSVRAGVIPLAEGAEERLLRICYAMAWFEEVYRTGRLWPGTPLGDADRSMSTSRLLAAVPAYAVADLRAQVHLAAGCLAGLRAACLPGQVRLGRFLPGLSMWRRGCRNDRRGSAAGGEGQREPGD